MLARRRHGSAEPGFELDRWPYVTADRHGTFTGRAALPGRARLEQARIAAALGSGANADGVLRRATAEGMPHGLATHTALRAVR